MSIGIGASLWHGARGGAAESGSGAYEGPLDLVPGAVLAFGQRALSAAMLGEALYTLKKLDGGAEPTQSFNSDAVTGDAPTASITAFLGADDGEQVVWNDQSGNNTDLATVDAGILWSASVQGGKPGFSGTQKQSETDVETTPFPNGQATIFAVCNTNVEITPSLSGQGYVSLDTQVASIDMFNAGSGNETGGAYPAAAVGIHLYDVAWEFGSKSFKVDGVELIEDEDWDNGGVPGAFVAELECRCLSGGGTVVEFIIYNTLLTDPQRLAIRTNIATYYGIAI